ncbi:MAG: PdxA family protein, partial [Planctomycetota bacterium]
AGRSPIMSFVGGGLRVALATVHIPLMQVAARLDGDALTRLILIASWQMAVRENLPGPVRVAVCGVNPHAGEGGLMGDEDDRIVRPAIERARRGDLPPELSAASAGTVSVTHDGSLPPLARIGSSHDATAAQAELIVSGPLPADTVFHRARQGDFDVVIAMYHDQGLIPIKTVAFHEAVNATLNLPFVRTSPDHGTAFDIAGKGIADPRSMLAAIRLADRWLGDQ